jgi:hypothetical protein
MTVTVAFDGVRETDPFRRGALSDLRGLAVGQKAIERIADLVRVPAVEPARWMVEGDELGAGMVAASF